MTPYIRVKFYKVVSDHNFTLLFEKHVSRSKLLPTGKTADAQNSFWHIFCPLYAKPVEKLDTNWHILFPYMRIGPEKLTQIDKNTHPILTHIFPLICESAPKTWPELTKSDTHFSPYMRISPKNLTRIDQNHDHDHDVKLSQNFPLYADWVENRDTNRIKMTQEFPLICGMAGKSWPESMKTVHVFWPPSFPLYAFWPEKVDQNWIKLTPKFPLICVLARKSWPELDKIDEQFWHSFVPYMRFGVEKLTKMS